MPCAWLIDQSNFTIILHSEVWLLIDCITRKILCMCVMFITITCNIYTNMHIYIYAYLHLKIKLAGSQQV